MRRNDVIVQQMARQYSAVFASNTFPQTKTNRNNFNVNSRQKKQSDIFMPKLARMDQTSRDLILSRASLTNVEYERIRRHGSNVFVFDLSDSADSEARIDMTTRRPRVILAVVSNDVKERPLAVSLIALGLLIRRHRRIEIIRRN